MHRNGLQVGMVNNAMIALTHEDPLQPNTPLSVCVAMSQAYIGYDLQNALREELLKPWDHRHPGGDHDHTASIRMIRHLTTRPNRSDAL